MEKIEEVLAMNNPADDISQKEKRAVLDNDRKVQGGTYFSHGKAAAEDTLGGRFAVTNRAQVTGATPYNFPRISESSVWAIPDRVGTEPPLGYAIDELEPTGEIFEQEQSMQTTSSPAASGDDVAPLSSRPPKTDVVDGGANKQREG